MQEEMMRRVGRNMSIAMGFLMSFCLSLIGTLTSGHFTFPGFFISFLVSCVVSILIGFVVPVGKVNAALCRKWRLKPGELKTRCIESMISNVIYTPLMTLIMVGLAYQQVRRNAPEPVPFLPMFLRSLLICFVAGYVIIFLCMPVLLGFFMKREGISK